MDQTSIFLQLQKFIESQKADGDNKKNTRLISALEPITERDISLGDAPKYFFARIECNSTGVGVSRFQGTETQRTVARDYTTDEHLFIDGHVGAGAKGLSLFHLKPGETVNYYPKSDMIKVAKEYGFQLHLQHFRDLNIRLCDHRLNRHTVHITKKPFSYPIYPIYASTEAHCEKFTIGYLYQQNGEEHILIEPEEPKSTGEFAKRFGCAPWMLLGLVFPPILLAIPIWWLAKAKKERMIG